MTTQTALNKQVKARQAKAGGVTVRKHYIRTNSKTVTVKRIAANKINRMALVFHVVRSFGKKGCTSAQVMKAIVKDGIDISHSQLCTSLFTLSGNNIAFPYRDELIRTGEAYGYKYKFNPNGVIRVGRPMRKSLDDAASTATLI